MEIKVCLPEHVCTDKATSSVIVKMLSEGGREIISCRSIIAVLPEGSVVLLTWWISLIAHSHSQKNVCACLFALICRVCAWHHSMRTQGNSTTKPAANLDRAHICSERADILSTCWHRLVISRAPSCAEPIDALMERDIDMLISFRTCQGGSAETSMAQIRQASLPHHLLLLATVPTALPREL